MGPRSRLLFTVLGAVIAGTVILAVALPTRPAKPTDLSWQDLRNAPYPSEFPRSKVARFANGSYEEEYVPGAATKLRMRMADIGAFGRLDEDAANDAAVVMIADPGGSGTFIHLAAVLNQEGKPHPITPASLGDRVAVRALRIADRRIYIRLRVRNANDPLTLLTREIERTYMVAGDHLVLEAETDVPPVADSRLTASPDRFVYQPTRIDFGPGTRKAAISGSLKPGGIGDFVLRGEAGQAVGIQVRSEFGNAILSVFGLSDTEPIVGRAEYATRWSGGLPSTQDYAVKVISVAGYDITYALTVDLQTATPTPLPTGTPRPLPTSVPGPSAPSPAPPSSMTLPGGVILTDQPLERLSPDAARFLQSRAPTWSVAVIVPAQRSIYVANGDQKLETASVVKVLVMLTVLDRAIAEHRPLDDEELELLWPMITESDNDSTTALWNQVGGGPAVAAYLRRIGVPGITPYNGEFWGTTLASARGIAVALTQLAFGDILDPTNRGFGLKLLTRVIPSQRWGVSAGVEGPGGDGDTVGLKDGWYPAPEGWRVNSGGVIIAAPNAKVPYIIAVMTNAQENMGYGIATIEGVATRVHAALHQ